MRHLCSAITSTPGSSDVVTCGVVHDRSGIWDVHSRAGRKLTRTVKCDPPDAASVNCISLESLVPQES